MPRVTNDGDNVGEWCDATGEGSSVADVCRACYRALDKDPHAYDEEFIPLLNWAGTGEPQGDAGWVGEVAHPPYEDEGYRCEVCDEDLTERDN